MKKALLILALLALATLSSIGSVNYQRFNPTATGNMCAPSAENPKGYCYKDLPAGGFPFSYLYDAGGISVEGGLYFIEDDFYPKWFLADVLFYFLVYGGILKLWTSKHCSNSKPSGS